MRRALTIAALSACGCSAATPPPPRPQEKPRPPETFAVVSPARWDHHPPAPTTALAAIKLEGGGCVLTAEGGQRWTTSATAMAGSRLVCSGKAEASAAVATEDLSGLLRRADGSWIFVGASGTLFEAPDPLGPFTRTVPAPEPLVRVAGAGPGVLATTQDGRLLRWEEARGWRPAATSGPIAAARVFDVVAGEGGRALALAFPETLFQSSDGGATWSRADAPTVGARLLGRTAGGDLGARGLFETLVWKPGPAPAFVRGKERVLAQQTSADITVGRAPTASALAAGRAVLDGDRYYEIVRPENDGDPWLFARGRIEGRLATAPIPASAPCGNLRLGARGDTVYLVCVSQDQSEIAAAIRRSTDAGATWSPGLRLVTPDTDQINIAVAPDGGALVVGLCRTSDAAGSCKPGAPLRIKADGALADAGPADAGANASGLHAQSASAPQLSGAALLPAFSMDGRSAYFLGRRGKDDRLHLFVSHDGGQSFTPRALETPGGIRPALRPRDDEEEPPDRDSPDTFEVDDVSALRPGDDGTVGMLLLRTRGDWAYVLTDDDGRVIQISGPPVDPGDDEGRSASVVMSGHGRRVLAVPMAPPESGPMVWESLDGGATWDRQAAPQSLAREYERGQPAVSCALGGCVIGETITRVGWGGAGADPSGIERPSDPPAPPPGGAQAPIVCELSRTPWARIDNALGGLSYAIPIPGMHEVMRGRAVWSVLTVDRKTGAIASVSAELPPSGEGEAHVVTRRLVGPKPGGRRVATSISASQHEGYAVVRVPIPIDARTGRVKIGAPMRDIEVAWENFFEGTSGRARIPDAGPFEANDVALGEANTRSRDDENVLPDVLAASLISISSRGIFVHPHQRRDAPSFFVDATGHVTRYTPHTWPSQSAVSESLNLRGEASAVGGELLGVALQRDGAGGWSTIALAHRRPGAPADDVSALSLLPPGSSLPVYTSWAWTAKAPVGLAAVVADPPRQKAWAHFVGFRSDGTFLPPEPMPTLLDLGDHPRGCPAADRAATPRVNVPLRTARTVLFPGMRHPVLVREPRPKGAVTTDDAFVLLTAGAALQGSLAAPCVAAWEAEAVGRAAAAAVLPGDLGRSWMFRASFEAPRSPGKRAEGAPAPPVIEYRPMACRIDPTARIPDAVWGEPGLSRP